MLQSPQHRIKSWGAIGCVNWDNGVATFIGPKESVLTVDGALLRSWAKKNYQLIGVFSCREKR